MQKSQGHICFVRGAFEDFEFFRRREDVYRAKTSDVIMTDGYRSGRWESSIDHFERFRDVILSGFMQITTPTGK